MNLNLKDQKNSFTSIMRRWNGIYLDILSTKNKLLLHFSTFCFVTTFVCQITEIILLVKNVNYDTERLFECFSIAAFCAMGILKLISFNKANKRWNGLLKNVAKIEEEQIVQKNSPSVEYESEDEDITPSLFTGVTELFERIATLMSKIYFTTATIFILSPFAEYALLIFRHASPKWPHVLPGWAPLDDLSFYGYLVNVIMEVVAAASCIYVHMAFDVTSVGVMIFACGQFSSIRESCEMIGGRGKVSNLNNKRDERARIRIRKCHSAHIMIKGIIDELRSLLKVILGVYFFIATLTLCSAAARFNSELSVLQLVSLIPYVCGLLIQLFLFCYYGNQLYYESSVGMGEGPFAAASWCLSPPVQRELVLLSFGMTRPQRLLAGPFTSLNLPSFIQVIRTAYSYYAVIRKN